MRTTTSPQLSRRQLVTSLALPWVIGARYDRVSEHPNPTAATVRSKYHLVRDWSFGRTIKTLDELHREFFTRFSYEQNTLDHFNDEWQRYRDDQNHVFTSEGLDIVARITNGMRLGGIESGMLRSRYHQEFGYFEGRLKVPRIRGAWLSFWLIAPPAEFRLRSILSKSSTMAMIRRRAAFTSYTAKLMALDTRCSIHTGDLMPRSTLPTISISLRSNGPLTQSGISSMIALWQIARSLGFTPTDRRPGQPSS
jgi:hypothetical protein